MVKKSESDPKKALENADKVLNSGLTGALTKGFMGKDFVDKMNSTLDKGQAAISGVEQAQWLAQNGLEATAEVIGVQDTGATVNNNPVVMLQLKLTSSVGRNLIPADKPWSHGSPCRLATGDKIKIKYNPADPTQLTIL